MADKPSIGCVGGPVGAVSSHGEAGIGEVLKPAASPNKAELRRLAESATPGHWVTDGEEIGGGGKIVAIYVAHEDGGRIGQVFANCLVPTDAKCRANAAFMAAANPTAVLSMLDECESLHSAMGSPDEITAEPAGDYEALRKQFMSLLMLANSKAKQAQHWRSQSGHAMHQTLVKTAANVNAERDTNAMLTDALMKAEAERDSALAELEALRGLLVQCTLSAETLRTDSLGHAQHCGFGDRMISAMRRLSGVKPGHGIGSRNYPSQAEAIDAAMSQEVGRG